MELYIKTTRVLLIFKKVQIASLTSGFFNVFLRVAIIEILYNIKCLKISKYVTLKIAFFSLTYEMQWSQLPIPATSTECCRRIKIKEVVFLRLQNKERAVFCMTLPNMHKQGTQHKEVCGARLAHVKHKAQEVNPGQGYCQREVGYRVRAFQCTCMQSPNIF